MNFSFSFLKYCKNNNFEINKNQLKIIDIQTGKTISILKINNEKISRPFVFNKKLLLIKNNSIVRLD